MSSHISDLEENTRMNGLGQAMALNPPEQIVKGRRRLEESIAYVAIEQEKEREIKESTAWDVYNQVAGEADKELVTNWRECLNTLLLFAAIFAAVLTGFIIESMKKLEQDPLDVHIMLANFNRNNNRNASNLLFIKPDFTPASSDIIVNCLLFTSLGAAVAAALASVLAIQWVAEYDTEINRGGLSPVDRAKRRQFRFEGIKRWKMDEIIAALPLLLHASVALFGAAASQWIWSINHQVGYVVIVGTAVAFLFYLSTTLLASISTSVPFRTPLSRGIYWAWQLAIREGALLATATIFIAIITVIGYLSQTYITITVIIVMILFIRIVVGSHKPLRRWVEVNLGQKRAPSWLMWFVGCVSILGAVSFPEFTTFDGWIFTAVMAVLFWPGFRAPLYPVLRFLEAKLLWAEVQLLKKLKLRQWIGRLKEQVKTHRWVLLLIWTVCLVVGGAAVALGFIVAGMGPMFLMIPFIIFFPGFGPHPFPLVTRLKRGAALVKRVVLYLKKRSTPREREKQAPDLHPFLRQQALSWLASQLPTSVDAIPKLLLLIAGVVGLSHETILPHDFFHAPWRAILDVLGRHYMQKVLYETPEADDYEAIKVLLLCSSIPEIHKRISPTNHNEETPSHTDYEKYPSDAHYERDPSNPTYWSQCCLNRESFRKELSPANMTFLLARDVPIPTAGSKIEPEATVQLIRWRNSTGPKDISPWTTIFGHAERYSLEYLNSCVESFGEVLRVLTNHQNTITSFASLLVNVQSEDGKYVQMTEVLEAFDMCMILNTDSDLHGKLVRIMCRDLGQTRDQWPRSSICPPDIVQRVTRIKDPYLAIIGSYTCGISISVKGEISKAYLGKYSESLSIVQSMLYKDVTLMDPMEWQLRTTFTSKYTSISVQGILNEALKDLDQLLLLQVIFELPASCHRDILGSRHMLLHLYRASTDRVYWNQKKRTLGSVELMGANMNPIIALLSLSDAQSLSGLTFGDESNIKPIRRVREICNGLRKEPLSFILFLSDIAHQASQAPCVPKVVALILDLAAEAMVMPKNDATTYSLRLLAYFLQTLNTKMIRDETESAEDAEDAEIVDTETARICELLLFSVDTNLHHRQVLARGAVNWSGRREVG